MFGSEKGVIWVEEGRVCVREGSVCVRDGRLYVGEMACLHDIVEEDTPGGWGSNPFEAASRFPAHLVSVGHALERFGRLGREKSKEQAWVRG